MILRHMWNLLPCRPHQALQEGKKSGPHHRDRSSVNPSQSPADCHRTSAIEMRQCSFPCSYSPVERSRVIGHREKVLDIVCRWQGCHGEIIFMERSSLQVARGEIHWAGFKARNGPASNCASIAQNLKICGPIPSKNYYCRGPSYWLLATKPVFPTLVMCTEPHTATIITIFAYHLYYSKGNIFL